MKDDGKDKDNIVPITDAKKGAAAGAANARRKNTGGDGLSAFDRKSMEFNKQAKFIEDGLLGEKYHVVLLEGSRFIVRELKDKVVEYVSQDHIVSMYLTKAVEDAKRDPSIPTRIGEAEEIVKKFKNIAQAIPEPKKVAFLSDPAMCFKRLPFDYDPNKSDYHHPTWDIILNNIEWNKAAFMQYIGSLFFEESYNQQYLWMYGDGGDGKGSVLSYLSKLLGQVCKPVSEDIGNPHWTSSLVGLRVAYFSDCRNYGITNTGRFMAITGGNEISVNPKGKPQFSIKNEIKFIFASNNQPKIDHVESSIRRILIIPFIKRNTPISDPLMFEKKLDIEGVEFIQHCIKEYLVNCPNHGLIKHDQDYDIGVITSQSEADKQLFLNTYFGIEAIEKDQDFNGKEGFIYAVPGDVMEIKLREYFGKNADTTFFKNWIRTRYQIIYKQKRINKERPYCYCGLRLLSGR